MKQTTKNILGIGAVVLLSAGVAGVTTYTMLKPENRDSLSFNEQFRQNPGARLAAYDAINAQPAGGGKFASCFSTYKLDSTG